MHHLRTMAQRQPGSSTGRGLSQNASRSRRSEFQVAVDLNQLLVRQASSAQVLQMHGHHSADLGVLDGDLVVVDSSLQAGANDLLVLGQGSDVHVRRQHQLTPGDSPWGVITAIIHPARPL